MQEIEDKLKKADMGFEVGDTQKLEAEYEKLIQKLAKLRKKQEDLGKADLSGIHKNIDKIGSGISKTISKVGRWALAVFAIESAYGMVRNAISTLSQYNEQMASDIEYIQFALASMLQPVIERLIGLVVKLLQYINYIAKAWFGVSLFANASASSFDKARNSTKKMAKDTKEMNKSLASGIDEITNLDTNKGTENSPDSDIGSIKTPSFDLSVLNGDIPSWLQWIVEHKVEILGVMAGVAGGLTAWKLGLSGLKSLGIGVTIIGIVKAIKSIMEYLKDSSWENFGKIILWIGVAIVGVGLAFASLSLTVAGIIAILVGLMLKFKERIVENVSEIADWLEKNLGEFGAFVASIIRDGLSSFDALWTGIKQIFDGIIKIAKGDFAGGLKSILKGVANFAISILNTVIQGINMVIAPIRGLIVAAGKVMGKKWSMSNIKIPTIPKLAKGGIVNNPGKGINMGSYVAGERGAEAVLPLQNSRFINDFAGQIANQMGNDINTQLLIDLNRNILELANRPNVFSVNGKEFARATYQDFENEKNRQQPSMTVVRR